ncbi:endonuclease exonuclease phosphatase family [Cryptosporidium sp. chipmunk genotype I]|uniref:endonuclease exonuclease phosphatase family n=1 Tax=Cryptosporidium sp. chipmunk genotype I TaxID=1280935 RepID=UPI00351A4065|nr:endonuclease exonuclease phosphatase family [Cryptosporidium sp. chipmunk genotype I]
MEIKSNNTNDGIVIFTKCDSEDLIITKCVIQLNEFENFFSQTTKGKVKNNICFNKISITMNRNPSEDVAIFTKRLALNLKKHIENFIKLRFNQSFKIDTSVKIQDNNFNDIGNVTLEDIINNENLNVAKVIILSNNENFKEFYYLIKKNVPLVESVNIKNEIRWGFPIVPTVTFIKGELTNFSYKWYLQYNINETKTKHDILQNLPENLIEIDQNYICDLSTAFANKERISRVIENIENYSIIFRIILNSERSSLFDTIYRFNHINKPLEASWREERIYRFKSDLKLRPELNINRLKIVTFNILSEICAQTDKALNEMYTNCPQYALNSNYRRSLLARELIDLDADVIGLQEVQSCLYESFIHILMEFKGYSGVFNSDCASVSTFYKKKLFNMLESETLLFKKILIKDYPEITKEIKVKWPNFIECLLDNITTVYQIVVLEHKITNVIYLFANTHFYYHPFGGHVRILQAKLLMDLIEKYLKRLRSSFSYRDIFAFIFGDFNTLAISDARTLFTEGIINSNSSEWIHSALFKYKKKKGLEVDNENVENDDNAHFTEDVLKNFKLQNFGFDFQIKNKCIDLLDIHLDKKHKNIQIRDKEKERIGNSDSKGFNSMLYYPFTNKVDRFSGQLDYIYLVEEAGFSDKFNIFLNNFLPYIDEATLSPINTLPSPQYPSDHISIGIDISITKNEN